MKKVSNSYDVIGTMSGTSTDGLDICFASFWWEENSWKYQIIEAVTIPYPDDWQEKLKNLTTLSGLALAQTNVDLGLYMGQCIDAFMNEHQIKPDFIASHGHTVFHQPEKKLTVQIGSGAHIRAITQLPVVCDFRVGDVALGGQGAPLVPIGDALLFTDYLYCLNLGGIANISFDVNGKRIAYDICPANIVLNELSGRKGKPYDEFGELARSGKIIASLLEQLNNLAFYAGKPPKSLGREWIEKNIFPLLSENLQVEDLSATFCEHIALQISTNCKQSGKMLVTGGGTYHQFLIERIQFHLPKITLVIPEKKIIDFKEALIFGFLGVLSARKETNCLSSVTGAISDSCCGVWYI